MEVRVSYRKRFSSDAKVIWALINKQPLELDELCKKASISISTFYRILPILKDHEIVKKVNGKYALFSYEELEGVVDEALKRLKEMEYFELNLDDLANEVGKAPEDIKKLAYQLAPKHNITIGRESKRFKTRVALF